MGKRTEHVVGVPLSLLCVFLASRGLEHLVFILFHLHLRNEIGVALIILIARVAARIVVLGFVLRIARCFEPKLFPAIDYVDLLTGELLSILLTGELLSVLLPSITAISWQPLTILLKLLECASCLLTSTTC